MYKNKEKLSLDDFNDADLGSLQSPSFNPQYTQKNLWMI